MCTAYPLWHDVVKGHKSVLGVRRVVKVPLYLRLLTVLAS